MNRKVILIFALIISVSSFGQITNEFELTGKWRVDEILDKPSNPEYQPLIDGFKNSTFNFKENQDFELTTTHSSELFEMMMNEVLNEPKWIFETEKQLVRIGTHEERYTSMEISVRMNNGNLFFHIEESGLTFLMKKRESL